MERGPCYYPFPRECCKMQNCNAYFYHAFKYLIAPSVRVRGISPFHLRIFFKNAIHEGIKIPGKKELPFYFFFFIRPRFILFRNETYSSFFIYLILDPYDNWKIINATGRDGFFVISGSSPWNTHCIIHPYDAVLFGNTGRYGSSPFTSPSSLPCFTSWRI